MTFREKFKYYKQKISKPEFDDVLDFSKIEETGEDKIRTTASDLSMEDLSSLGLNDAPEWNIFQLVDKPGLIFICNPFTATGQRLWTRRSLADYTRKPSRLNLDIHGDLKHEEDWWTVCCSDFKRSSVLQKKLRWATLGYHHNWDTKKYSEDNRSIFPADLARLSQVVIEAALGYKNFIAEAAIVNFYHMDSTLSGHVDSSETNLEAPLISFSFGQSAIFLMGGSSLDDEPTAMYIHSGDVVIMSGPSRLCYHGVPRILYGCSTPWDVSSTKNSFDNAGGLKTSEDKVIFENSGGIDCDDWTNFHDYIKTSRINLNVRQVSFYDNTNSENGAYLNYVTL